MRTVGWLVATVLAAIPATASAQDSTDGFDAHGFYVAAQDGDPRDLLAVERAGRFHGGEFWVTGLFEYAERPLVLVSRFPDDRDDTVTPVLDDVFALNLSAGVAVHDRIRLDLRAPLFLSSSGPDDLGNGTSLGDMRLTAMVGLVRPKLVEEGGGGFGLAVVPFIDLPLGNPDIFLGESGLAGGGKLAATFETGSLTISGDIGARFRRGIVRENLDGSDLLEAGLGLGYLFSKNVGLNAEVVFGPPFSPNREVGTGNKVELLGNIRGRTDGGFHWLAGASGGLSRGAGAAVYRLFLGVGYGKIRGAGPKDTDKDGLIDPEDECPRDPETFNSYKDTDGCPDELGTILVSVVRDGAKVAGVPVDADGVDDFTSTSDAFVIEGVMPGTSLSFNADHEGHRGAASLSVAEGEQSVVLNLAPYGPATVNISVVEVGTGAPIPNAGLAFAGGESAPDPMSADASGKATVALEPGRYTVSASDPAGGHVPTEKSLGVNTPGSEVAFVIELPAIEGGVIAFGTIYFDLDQHTVRADSMGVIDDAATTLKANSTWILKMQVQGHTDEQGSADYNKGLSQRRVDEVVRLLKERGVTVDLVPKGFGESRLVKRGCSDDACHAQNRRVEFHLLETDDSKRPAGLEVRD